MDFREATDGLFDRIDHAELARALGVSVASVRQARLKPSAGAHRSPPQDWQPAIIQLAEQRRRHYDALIARLRERD
jgi:hypothetical protein